MAAAAQAAAAAAEAEAVASPSAAAAVAAAARGGFDDGVSLAVDALAKFARSAVRFKGQGAYIPALSCCRYKSILDADQVCVTLSCHRVPVCAQMTLLLQMRLLSAAAAALQACR